MDLAIIKNVQDNGTWQSKNGLMYSQEVELEDGRVGQVNAKTAGKWKAGDKVEVKSSTPSSYGTRFSFGIPLNVSNDEIRKGETAQAKPWNKEGFSDDRQHQINASWSIGQAIALGFNDGEQIKDAARKLLAYRETIIGELKAGALKEAEEVKPDESTEEKSPS